MILLICATSACRPKNQDILVTCARGNVFYGMRLDGWYYGDVKECEFASDVSTKPDARGNLLVCGREAWDAWDQTWLRADIKTQIYGSAKKLHVTFSGRGHAKPYGGGKNPPTVWNCTRTQEGLTCK